ncbi:hypothetical protein BDP27DRAFT_1229272, partial [Rhodocollybia butyracea]
MPLCSSCGRNTFIHSVVVDLPGIQNKLRTESGPASVQSEEVASVLKNIEQDLEDYRAEISRLEQGKERLENYAAQLRSLNSPFRKVPDEILRHIFDECCDMNTFRALRSKPAMVISSVCSRWRRNALSMPAIWSRISLSWDMSKGDRHCEEDHLKIFFPMFNFLDRSQQHPMTVVLDMEN